MAEQAKQGGEKKLTGRHVLIWICGFFGVMFIANGFFVYYARTSWPGVVEKSPYTASQNFNKTLSEAAAQDALGWAMSLEFKRRQSEVYLVVSARDKLGNAIDDLTIEANVGRPATENFDHNLTLEPTSDGVYQAKIGALDPGRWRVKFEALQKGEVKFQSLDTISLK